MKKLLFLLAEIYVLVPHVLAQSNKDKKAGTLGHISFDPLPVYDVAFFSESLQRHETHLFPLFLGYLTRLTIKEYAGV